MSDTIEQIVHEALTNAYHNGYEMNADLTGFATPEEVARDLTNCCSDLEYLNPSDIEPHVRSWLAKNR